MATAPPILIWQPRGGVPVGPISNPPVYSQAGITPLINGQSYVDVVFGSTQTTAEWVLVECEVVNTTDLEPLNIWPGIVTSKLTTGFRLQLNGMPDSNNYYLHWAVSGVNIAPVPATSYLLSGPSSAAFGEGATFTVRLPPSTSLPGPLTVTPDDGGAGGVFSPTSVVLTTTSASATFTYTAASYGTKTISVTNSGTLTDPASIAFNSVAPTYGLTGPSTGDVGVTSTNFTVTLSGAVVGTVTVTPSSGGGGGTFTPTTVALTTAAPSATFTYTPASAGAKTISVTNSGGLTNPGSLTYTAITPPFDPLSIAGCKLWLKADSLPTTNGTPIATWVDASGNGNDAVQGTPGNRPTTLFPAFTGMSAAHFNSGAPAYMVLPTPFSGAGPWTVIAVIHNGSGSFEQLALGTITANDAPYGPRITSSGSIYAGTPVAGGYTIKTTAATFANAWHAVSVSSDAVITADGAGSVSAPGLSPLAGIASFDAIGYSAGIAVSDGYLAEILLYNSVLSTSDRTDVENYLKAKYGI